ncbi:MAG: hypothetical protein Tsb0021_14310 [Chlamydiales bacterium]
MISILEKTFYENLFIEQENSHETVYPESRSIPVDLPKKKPNVLRLQSFPIIFLKLILSLSIFLVFLLGYYGYQKYEEFKSYQCIAFQEHPVEKTIMVHYSSVPGFEKTPFHIFYLKEINGNQCTLIEGKYSHQKLKGALGDISKIKQAIENESIKDFEHMFTNQLEISIEELKYLQLIHFEKVNVF